MLKALLLIFISTMAFANPIQDCKEYLDGELWSYEYYPKTKSWGDVLFYQMFNYGETHAARKSRLRSRVHAIFRTNFDARKQFYLDKLETPEPTEHSITQIVRDWYDDTLDEWGKMPCLERKGCWHAPNRPSQMCYRHFEAYFPYLSYIEETLAHLRSSIPGTKPNANFLRATGGILANKFYRSGFPLESAVWLLLQFEKHQPESSALIISGIDGTEGARLFNALLEALANRATDEDTPIADRILQDLRARQARHKRLLTLCFG